MARHETSARNSRTSYNSAATATAPARSPAHFADRGPAEINPIQWHQAMGYARTQCARIFRDGGAPADALKTFSLAAPTDKPADWNWAVQTIALHLCSPAR